MKDSVTNIKLFGLGIPRALQELNKIKPDQRPERILRFI